MFSFFAIALSCFTVKLPKLSYSSVIEGNVGNNALPFFLPAGVDGFEGGMGEL